MGGVIRGHVTKMSVCCLSVVLSSFGCLTGFSRLLCRKSGSLVERG